jgi:hypothetical protein
MGMKTLPYVTLVIAKTILFCIQNGGAYVQTNKQTLKRGKASPIASCGCVLGNLGRLAQLHPADAC